jgi:uncharacterized cupin superfamily protein
MTEIKVEKNPSEETLKGLGVQDWKIETLSPPPPSRHSPRRRILDGSASDFPWTASVAQIWYILEGQATVTPVNGKPLEIERGSMVTFPKGTTCVWRIRKTVKARCGFPQ